MLTVRRKSKMPENDTCCELRRKIHVGVLRVLDESECGVADAAMADVVRWDIVVPSGKPVIGFRFCPWCGHERTLEDEVTMTDVTVDEPEKLPDVCCDKCGVLGAIAMVKQTQTIRLVEGLVVDTGNVRQEKLCSECADD